MAADLGMEAGLGAEADLGMDTDMGMEDAAIGSGGDNIVARE